MHTRDDTERLIRPTMEEEQSTRSYWRFSKLDFFPESSFQDFPSYRSALSQTCRRLKDRFSARSSDSTELIDLKKSSENEMHRCLTWWDLLWLAFGAVVGSGIFVITGQETRNTAGPAITLSYAASGISALLSVFCYTEFAVEIPIAGGSFSYLRVELGDFVAFIAAGNILLEAVVGAAGLGRSWSSYCASIFTSNTDFFRFKIDSFAEGFNLLDPLAVSVLAIANTIAMTGTKHTSLLNWVSSMINAAVIIFIIIVGFIHANPSNLNPFFPFGAEGVFEAAAVVYWSYTGFDMVANMAEETKNPSRDIPIGLLSSMTIITVVYCLMSLALTMMVKYTEIDVNAAYSIAFDGIGMKWAKYLVSICALKGMTTSMLVGSMGQARYMTQIARAHMIPPWFALVHPKTGTPVYASLLVTILSCVMALFTSLDVLSSVFSVSTLFIFMMVAVALLVRRYYVKDVTGKVEFSKFLVCLLVVIGSSVGMMVLWSLNKRGWIGYSIFGAIWFMGTLGMSMIRKSREPKVWGVPLVPWLPSISIAMNLFLIGSLGKVAFIRFIICSVVMVVYYLFIGLHATYDLAHDHEDKLQLSNCF
ncbi:cationic amino acid transporter 8, vacuolar-like [Impatiens glandulifera]|uniref:cationic amino acid transporter 8, vacuolar-like n=1 Tax=Impatiens glandulifera TaxID=253017 RepID=UPI001FB12C40|nr:cationic amino acid transporter 8, vacuolar-like [Impatiens glandulifera]